MSPSGCILGTFSDRVSSKLVDDIVYEVDCQNITVKAGADVDIGADILCS